MTTPDLADDLNVKARTENNNQESSARKRAMDPSLLPIRALARISACIHENCNRDYLFRDVVGKVPFAMGHPEVTHAWIEFDGQNFYSEGYADCPWTLKSRLVVDGRKLGFVLIGYSEERPEREEGPFSGGERFFIDALAHMLSLGIEQRRAKDSLCDAEQKFLAMFNNALNGVLLVERFTKKCCLANDKLCEMLGYGLDEFVELTVSDIQPGLGLDDVLEQLCDPLLGQHSLTENVPLRRKNGSTLYVDMSSFPIVVGNRGYLLDIFKEVTERRWAQEQQLRAADQLRLANTEMREFVSALHEGMKSLLQEFAMPGATPISAEGPVEAQPRVGGLAQMDALVEAIGHYAAIGSRIETTEMDLNDLIQETISRLAVPHTAVITTEGLWPVARFDRNKMADVLYHLLSNGIQSLKGEAGSVKLRCVEEASRYTLSISDTGAGVAEKDHEQIFQMFYRIPDDIDAPERLGIGLAVVRKSVEAWGGRIWIESKSGAGSTFYITVPKVDAVSVVDIG